MCISALPNSVQRRWVKAQLWLVQFRNSFLSASCVNLNMIGNLKLSCTRKICFFLTHGCHWVIEQLTLWRNHHWYGCAFLASLYSCNRVILVNYWQQRNSVEVHSLLLFTPILSRVNYFIIRVLQWFVNSLPTFNTVFQWSGKVNLQLISIVWLF